MASRADVEFFFLVLGYIFTGALYLSPVPTMWSICRAANVGEFKADMFLTTINSCLVWLQYGLSPPLSRAIVIINGIGILIEGTYIGIYIRMATVPIRRRIGLALVFMVCILGMMASVIFPVVNNAHRHIPLGVMGDVASVLMYADPARQLKAVWTTKDVRNMSFCVAAASLCSGISWTTYAGLIRDWYLLIPNAIGILLALVQLVFYVLIKYFYQAPGAAGAGVPAAGAGGVPAAGAGLPAEAAAGAV